MTVSTERKVTEPVEEKGSTARSIIWMMLSAIGIVFVGGAIVGFVAEHQAQGGGPFDIVALLILAVMIAMIGALAYAIWRNGRQMKLRNEKLPRREKLHQRVLVVSALSGAAIALIVMAGSTQTEPAPSVFSNAPIEPWTALLAAALIGVAMPLFSWYWHNRVIDEQEADAYRSGALLAVYAYWIIAPTWWLLWRGGLVPAPDGIAIYMITIFTALAVWFWKKYR